MNNVNVANLNGKHNHTIKYLVKSNHNRECLGPSGIRNKKYFNFASNYDKNQMIKSNFKKSFSFMTESEIQKLHCSL